MGLTPCKKIEWCVDADTESTEMNQKFDSGVSIDDEHVLFEFVAG